MASAKKKTVKGGLDKSGAGGRWDGTARSHKPRRVTLAQDNPDPGFTWSGLPADILFLVVALSVVLVGFVVTTSFLAEATGEGIALAVSSLLVALALPGGVAFWAVRPLHRRRAYHWWLAVFSGPYLLATMILCIAAPARTSRMLRWHGAWPARLMSRDAGRRMQVVVEGTARLLSLLPKDGGQVEIPPAQDRISFGKQPPPAYLGRLRPKKSPNILPEDFGRRPGSKVLLHRRNTVWTLTIFGTKKKRPLSMLLAPQQPWTILTQETAARLHIPIPEQGAFVEMRGSDMPAVLVDRFFLGGLPASHVTVIVCSSCVPSGLSGLVGRNLLRRFRVSLDSKKGRLTVSAAKPGMQTPEDVDPFVIFDHVRAKRTDDGLTVSGRVRNIAPLAMVDLAVDIVFYDAADRITQTERLRLGRLAPGATKHIEQSMTSSEISSGFRFQTAMGRWSPIGARVHRRRRYRRHAVSPSRKRARGVPAASR